MSEYKPPKYELSVVEESKFPLYRATYENGSSSDVEAKTEAEAIEKIDAYLESIKDSPLKIQ